jgi:hypothetical protein
MKNLIMLAVVMSLTGCAGAQLETEWKSQRGYSDADIAAIREQFNDYHQSNIVAGMQSNRFNSSPALHSQDRLKSIFCTCYQTIGDKCREKPDGLNSEQRTLWIKANAVDLALLANHTALDPGPAPKVDTAECGRSPASK